MSENKHPLSEVLPLQIYEADMIDTKQTHDVYLVSDVEQFLAKIMQPHRITKMIKAITFGQSLDLKKLLED